MGELVKCGWSFEAWVVLRQVLQGRELLGIGQDLYRNSCGWTGAVRCELALMRAQESKLLRGSSLTFQEPVAKISVAVFCSACFVLSCWIFSVVSHTDRNAHLTWVNTGAGKHVLSHYCLTQRQVQYWLPSLSNQNLTWILAVSLTPSPAISLEILGKIYIAR